MQIELTEKEFGILHFALWRLINIKAADSMNLKTVFEDAELLFKKLNKVENGHKILDLY